MLKMRVKQVQNSSSFFGRERVDWVVWGGADGGGLFRICFLLFPVFQKRNKTIENSGL